MKEILDKNHPKYEDFMDELFEEVDFRELEHGEITWNCNSTMKITRKILKRIGNIDIAKTIAYFESHGGYCDCEVCLNVEKKLKNNVEKKLKNLEKQDET